ncbi:MAG: hypothetical protein QGI09_06815, partial [Dehalococcoidia bacterium]|nr:hypothetical protein [Dehalococcoidia bacterium]
MKAKTWIAVCVIAALLCTVWIERGHAKTRKVAKTRWDLYGVYAYGPMNRQTPGLNRNAGTIEVMLAQGELESVCLVIDNRKGKDTLDFRVSIRSNARDGRMGFPKDRIRLGRIVYLPVRAKSKARRIHPAKAGAEVADAIVPMGVAEPLTVGPKEVRHIWLTLDARGASPGRYVTEVTVRPLTPT